MYLTVVMYHYVRPIAGSRYPDIKGLERTLFTEQILHLKKWYTVVSPADVIDAMRGGAPLPANAALLTFDDGYLDHFDTVFPVLVNEGLHGCFFPPAKCIEQRCVLDVNKIHYVLASCEDKRSLVDGINAFVEKHSAAYGLSSVQEYEQLYAHPNRYDTGQVIYIKRMLQVGLPEVLRGALADELFSEFVDVSEECLSHELYMTKEQLRCMASTGMTIGSHGYDHYWMDQLNADDQHREVRSSLRFLDDVGVNARKWVMCYPYGAWNAPLLDLLSSQDCGLGLTTEVDVADVRTVNPLLIPRLDTNDLPKDRSAAPSKWTRSVVDVGGVHQ